MDVKAFQRELARLGFYKGVIDGAFGPKSRAALREALAGSTDRLTPAQIEAEATALGLTPAHVGAVYDVESNGRGMSLATGLPVILFEPHVFSRLTARRFDASHPTISYRTWKTLPYPDAQAARWDQMFAACALDPNAALQSASWGLFQIMGFNHAKCGMRDPWGFARANGEGEGTQLGLFAEFLESSALLGPLKRKDWRTFEERYNGGGHNGAYAKRLAAAYAKRGGR